MKKVKVYQYKSENGHLKKKFIYNAVFHAFGVGYEEFEGGPGNYSTAIVELENGELENVSVEMVKFIKS